MFGAYLAAFIVEVVQYIRHTLHHVGVIVHELADELLFAINGVECESKIVDLKLLDANNFAPGQSTYPFFLIIIIVN